MRFLLVILMLSFAVNVYGADFTIQIPDERVEGVLDAFAISYNYQEIVENPLYDPIENLPNPEYNPEEPESEPTIPNPLYSPEPTIPNPITKSRFTKNCIISFIKHVYVSNRVQDRVEIEKAQAIADAISEIEGLRIE